MIARRGKAQGWVLLWAGDAKSTCEDCQRPIYEREKVVGRECVPLVWIQQTILPYGSDQVELKVRLRCPMCKRVSVVDLKVDIATGGVD